MKKKKKIEADNEKRKGGKREKMKAVAVEKGNKWSEGHLTT